MAEQKRNEKADIRYRKNKFEDAPVAPDIKKSISELRRVYSSFTDTEFAAWYYKRYSVPARSVLRFLASETSGGGRDRDAGSK